MKTFEYEFFEFSAVNDNEIIHQLDKLGSDGWQIVGQFQSNDAGNAHKGLFMRKQKKDLSNGDDLDSDGNYCGD